MLNQESRFHTRLWSVVAAVFALQMLPVPFAICPQLVDHGPTWLGIDGSARVVLNYAWKENWNWGHDIVYTYGPLSFLATRVGLFVPAIWFILFDGFILANFFFLFRDFILATRYRTVAAAAVFLMTLTLPLCFGSGIVWILMVFCFYWMYRSISGFRWWQFAMLIILITITFYLKLNTGLFIILFLTGYLATLLFSRRISVLQAAGVLSVLLISICGCALLFHVSLSAYVRGAIAVMKGYNDLMYLTQEHTELTESILMIFTGVCTALCLVFGWQSGRRNFTTAFLTLLCLGYFFLLKKQALFRNDTQHLFEFFPFVPLLFFCGILPHILPADEKLRLGLVIGLTLSCFLTVGVQPLFVSLRSSFIGRYEAGYHYLKGIRHFHEGNYLSQRDKRLIPPPILQRIGNSRVDVFPWDANYLLQNGLNYSPRPCFQTFQANSDYLQQINYDFYQDHGPDFVIYDYDAIDNAYPFNDAPKLNLFISSNYRVVDSFTSNERWRILLQRNSFLKPVQLTKVRRENLVLNNTIMIKGARYLQLNVQYTATGKLNAIWDKPDPLTISYENARGEWRDFKTSTELLKTGIYTGRFIRNNADFARLVSGDTSEFEPVVAVRVVGNPGTYQSCIAADFYQ